MGSYPVAIKCDRVLALHPHPAVFQCYKTFWVFVGGWFFLLFHNGAGFQFCWWAVLSAFCWVPAGLGLIFAIPIIGVGLCSVLATGANVSISFLVFWLVFDASFTKHGSPGHEYYLAPFYLACVLLGMAALLAIPHLRSCRRVHAREAANLIEPEAPSATLGPRQKTEECSRRAEVQQPEMTTAKRAAGVGGALLAGVLSSIQFGVASKARSMEEAAAGCIAADCPPALQERFNNFGSWMTSFGIGSALATVFFLGFFFLWEWMQGRPLPRLHVRALLFPGSVAGIAWLLGNFFLLAAVMRGGAAAMAASNQSFHFVVSGAWGLLYYREVRGVKVMSLWVLAAAWTVAAAVLLCREKV